MASSFTRIAWECFLDLGATIVYATLAGLLIVGIAATDDGPGTLLTSALYASLLPASVAILIAVEAVTRLARDHRIVRDRRDVRDRRARRADRAQKPEAPGLGLTRF